MKIQIDLKACRYCKFFVCVTEDGMDLLDIPTCSRHNIEVTDYYSCDEFKIKSVVLKEIRNNFNPKFVKVVK